MWILKADRTKTTACKVTQSKAFLFFLFFPVLLSSDTIGLCSTPNCYPIICLSKRETQLLIPFTPVFQGGRLLIFPALIRRNTFHLVKVTSITGYLSPFTSKPYRDSQQGSTALMNQLIHQLQTRYTLIGSLKFTFCFAVLIFYVTTCQFFRIFTSFAVKTKLTTTTNKKNT